MLQLKVLFSAIIILFLSCAGGAQSKQNDSKPPKEMLVENDSIIEWNITIPQTANTRLYQTFWVDNSLKAEGPVVNNKKNGLWKIYFKGTNGKQLKAEVTYKNDIIEGELKEYYPSGKLIQKTYYKNGILNGSREIFYETGYGKFLEYYKDGKKNGRAFEYFDNGNTKENAYFHNDLRNGMSTSFHYNGKRKSCGRYVMGRKNGPWEFYSELGLPESRGYFKNDEKTGVWTLYDTKGIKIEEKKYN